MVSLKTKFYGISSIGGRLNLCWGSSRLCRMLLHIWRHITSGQPEPIVVVAVGAINMRSTAIHCKVQYSNMFDILLYCNCHLIETHRGVRTSFMSICMQANCCNAVFSCCCYTRVCLLVATRSNTLYIAVNYVLIRWGATFRCCQMCWLFVLSPVIRSAPVHF